MPGIYAPRSSHDKNLLLFSLNILLIFLLLIFFPAKIQIDGAFFVVFVRIVDVIFRCRPEARIFSGKFNIFCLMEGRRYFETKVIKNLKLNSVYFCFPTKMTFSERLSRVKSVFIIITSRHRRLRPMTSNIVYFHSLQLVTMNSDDILSWKV